ncbi:MAG: LytS/YhcK type 5TM receptor domain-containing protein [Pseudomonadota bacterium]
MLLDLVADVFTSMALLLGLAHIFGTLSRHTLNLATKQTLLGLCFGLVSFLQLQNPFEAMPGVIIDLRNVPVLLAGAFLGWRGASITILIAACTRYSIGGAGMVSGIAAIGLAGGFGIAWSYWVQRVVFLRWFHIGALTVLGMSTMVAGLLLEARIAWWFYTNAAPLLVVAYAVSVPIGAVALAAQRNQVSIEASLRAAARNDPETGFLNWASFYREICVCDAMRECNPTKQILLIKVKSGDWVADTWGATTVILLLRAIRAQLDGHPLFKERLFGITPDSRIAVQVLDRDLVHLDQLVGDLTRLFESTTISPDGIAQVQANIEIEQVGYTDDLVPSRAGFLRMLEMNVKPMAQPQRTPRVAPMRTDVTRFEFAGREAVLSDKLFSKMDCLIGARQQARI